MTVKVGTGGIRTRFIKTDWPVEEGLTAGTTKLAEEPNLRIEEDDLVSEREKVGL